MSKTMGNVLAEVFDIGFEEYAKYEKDIMISIIKSKDWTEAIHKVMKEYDIDNDKKAGIMFILGVFHGMYKSIENPAASLLFSMTYSKYYKKVRGNEEED